MRIDHLILNQYRLSTKIRLERIRDEVHLIAGVDVAATPASLFGCIGVFSFPGLDLIEYSCAQAVHTMPYIPGFLSFREIPVILKCYEKLKQKPDLLLIDGQGIAHPRAVGIASHLGIILYKPTIGCAKSHLFGDFEMPGSAKGSYSMMTDGERNIGLVLRTRDKVQPLFVSPGNLVDLEDCRKYVLASLSKYRIPQPLRFAHKTAGEWARRFDV